MRPSARGETLGEDLPLDGEKSEGVKADFQNVSFKYPTRDISVLDNLNMHVGFTAWPL
jgi:ABC-type transport system involved in cytochrome bd biosynthesis fused ATPase/permease subunit